jgi:hypothetical protein
MTYQAQLDATEQLVRLHDMNQRIDKRRAIAEAKGDIARQMRLAHLETAISRREHAIVGTLIEPYRDRD